MSARFLAQIPLGDIEGIGPYGTSALQSSTLAIVGLGDIISNIIGLMTILGGIWFFIQIIISAIAWISSGGDKQNLQTAQKRLTNAVIGLFIVVASYAIAGVIGLFFGLDILQSEVLFGMIHP